MKDELRDMESNGTVNTVKRPFKMANNKSTSLSIPSGKRTDDHS
jgi:hypothetical protein